MRILITGADGFIASNLRVRLREANHQDVICITRASSSSELTAGLADADFVFHVAGVNRPKTSDEFMQGNRDFTGYLCDTLLAAGRRIPVVFASSIQAEQDNPYGQSKLAAEHALLRYREQTGAPLFIFRLTNVFGKWARPNYNSVIATFCHNIARGLPISINDAAAKLRLTYIDDVADAFLRCLTASSPSLGYVEVGPVYEVTVGEIAGTIRGFFEKAVGFCDHIADRLRRALARTIQEAVRPPDGQILEEDGVQLVVVILARVDQYVVAVLIEPRDHARQPDNLRPRSDHRDDLQPLHGATFMAIVSGLARSKISFAHSMTISSSLPTLVTS